MNSKRFIYLGFLVAGLVVAACNSGAAPTATPEAGAGEVPMGFTEEGAPYRGNPDAPVTLVEYSEFQ
ncbi:MAG: hypothetical protein SVX38_15120 [Chloroflexota bacterium]|nr:hypothetical protein [Chloroflexota bacterium]